MKRLLIAFAVTFFVIPASHAADIIKCISASGVTYQTTPCAGSAAEVLAIPPSARTETGSDEDVGVAAPAQTTVSGRQDIDPSRGLLDLGTPDIVVLNNRRWGKPQRITRNREARAWHEYWNYEAGANGGKQLHFVNGRLAGIADLEPKVPAVIMTPVMLLDEH